MKTIRLISFILVCVLTFGCSSHDDESGPSDVNQEEIEQINAQVNQVSDDVSIYFHDADNATDMAMHLDEISAMEQVESAWAEDDAVFAKLKNGITLFWYFPPEDEEIKETSKSRFTSVFKDTVRNNVPTRASAVNHEAILSTNQKVCIINQVSRDKHLDYVTTQLEADAQVFRNYGFQVTEVPSEKFTPDFIRESLASFNVIILCTHGVYVEKSKTQENNKQHWMFTGLEMPSISKKEFNDLFKGYASIGILKERRSTDIDKKDYQYLCVSEKWLDNNLGFFPSNSLMFAAVCHTLEGNEDLYNVVLKNRNLGCFLGFDDSVGCHFAIEESLDMFMSLMVIGSTAKGAYDLLDDQYKIGYSHENQKENQTKSTNLIYLQRDGNTEISMCDAVDMGLSVMWGTRNLGAMSPVRLGDFYQWGDVNIYEDGNEYKFWETDEHKAVKKLGDEISGNPQYDPATALLGKPWRMPTKAECEELINACTIISVGNKEMFGEDKWVTGSWGGVLMVSNSKLAEKRSAAIYLPYYWNSRGSYWTGTLVPDNERFAWEEITNLEAYNLNVSQPAATGENGRVVVSKQRRVWLSSIRPVYDPQ